jgi:hypothetical protein
MIYVYNLRNFEEVVVINLAEELKKGLRRLDLPTLFKPRAQVPVTQRVSIFFPHFPRENSPQEKTARP